MTSERSYGTMPVDPESLTDQNLDTFTKKRGFLQTIKHVARSNTGLVLIGAAQAFFASINLAVKLLHNLDPPVSTLQLVFMRSAITYVCCMIYMLARKVEEPWVGPKGVRLLLVLRGFFGFVGLFGTYYALNYLSLSDSTSLAFLGPIFTAIACHLVLGESFTATSALATISALGGVLLIARPQAIFGHVGADSGTIEKGTPALRLGAVGVQLVAVVGVAGAYTTIRAIGKRAHAMHAMAAFSLQCSVITAVIMVATHEPFIIPFSLQVFMLMVMIGLLGFIAQILLTMGLQQEEGGRATMAVYVQVVFALILEKIFFNTTPPLLSVLGTVIVLSSAFYVAWSKAKLKRVSKQPESPLSETDPLIRST